MVYLILASYLCLITTKAIIESLTKDGRFRSICKGIAKKPYLADDLYQEFFLSLCEIKDNRLEEAKNGGYLEVLCVGIINNIWGKRKRVNKGRGTHSLHEYSNYQLHVAPDFINDEDEHGKWRDLGKPIKIIPEFFIEEQSDLDKYEASIEASKKAKYLIQQSMESEDETERFNAHVFYYSRFKYKSPLQFHKESGIPARVCYYAYNNYRDQLKQKLCIS